MYMGLFVYTCMYISEYVVGVHELVYFVCGPSVLPFSFLVPVDLMHHVALKRIHVSTFNLATLLLNSI